MSRQSYRQSAALAYRIKKGKLRFLLVTSTNSKRWVLPKGMIERGLTAAQSAAKEAFEEAGIVGKTEKKKAGRYVYEKWGSACDVRVYPMRVSKELRRFPERQIRQRKWMSARAAAALVDEPELRKIIRDTAKRLKDKQKKKSK